MGLSERIAEIEAEMARTQKNKATEHHLGLLKAKLARLRSELLTPTKSSAKGEGFEVLKSGNARVALIGFPSVGKSTLLTLLTGTASEAAAYEFTTLTCIPGNLEYNGAKIQLLDLPGIIEGAASGKSPLWDSQGHINRCFYHLHTIGKGRGKQVIAVARTADLVLMMLDANKYESQRPLLERELEACGIRLNTRKPDIYFKKKNTGGIKFNNTCPLSGLTEKLAYQILHEYKIFNADILIREDCTADQFIDVILDNCVYVPCLYAMNKIDCVSLEEVDIYARRPHTVVLSCNLKLNLDYILYQIWRHLSLVRVYTKKPGDRPDFNEPLILRGDATVKDACLAIHRSLVENTKYAIVWGRSTKHHAQRVGMSHLLADEDVIQLVKINQI